MTLHGALPHDRVRHLFGLADAFVLCSRKGPDGDCEGTPTVLLEAQAAGLPCISTFHAGIPEIVPVENHDLLAEEGDVAGFAQRFVRLLEEEEAGIAQIAARGRIHIEVHFDLRNSAAQLRDLYRGLVGDAADTAPGEDVARAGASAH